MSTHVCLRKRVNRSQRSVSQSGAVLTCNTQTDEQPHERQICSFDKPLIDYMKSLFDVRVTLGSFKTSEIGSELFDSSSTGDDLKSDAADHRLIGVFDQWRDMQPNWV